MVVIYPLHNRLEYTKLTFPFVVNECLNTGAALRIYDDNSKDGSSAYIDEMLERYAEKLDVRLIRKVIGNSRYQINDTVTKTKDEYIVKIDNDIVIPIGYVERLKYHMDREQDIGFLMYRESAGWPVIDNGFVHNVSHIGGVGIFRRKVFDEVGLVRTPNLDREKRFYGFTELQNRAKESPNQWRTCTTDGKVLNLDKSPVLSRAYEYEAKGWSRLLGATKGIV